MTTTIFLAQIWGPILLAVAIGFFVSRSFYIGIYRDLEKNAFAVFLFAMAAIAVGVVQIQTHNEWATLPQIIISILGWGTLVKGFVFAIVPNFVDKVADWEADSNLVPFAGGFMLILGAYLTWFGYFL